MGTQKWFIEINIVHLFSQMQGKYRYVDSALGSVNMSLDRKRESFPWNRDPSVLLLTENNITVPDSPVRQNVRESHAQYCIFPHFLVFIVTQLKSSSMVLCLMRWGQRDRGKGAVFM